MSNGTASIKRQNITIPTYTFDDPETLPVFYKLRNVQGTYGGIYPYRMSDKLLWEKVDQDYDAVILENDFIRIIVLPELGGRIYEGYDKVNDYHFVYKNNVIKPALIGLCGLWLSGGIEFNWPQHHKPTTYMPSECAIEENADGSKTAWVGETESMSGQKCAVGVTIHPDKAYIEANIKLFNGTPQVQTFHWWANLAVHTNDDYRLLFPPDIDYVTSHNRTAVSEFPVVSGLFGGANLGDGVNVSRYGNLMPAGSFFIFDSNYSFMAGYDDTKGMGTVHIADRHISPGKKFFGWGNSPSGKAWQDNLTDEDGPYLEIMTGVYTDNQPDFTWIAPYETKVFTQRWYSICGLPYLKNANESAALSIENDGSSYKVAFNVMKPFDKVSLSVTHKDRELLKREFSAKPGCTYADTLTLDDKTCPDEVVITLSDENGIELIEYRTLPMFFDDKEKPEPRFPAKDPCQIESSDDLWINGVHIEQYKNPYIKPDPYYLEVLKRDPYDIRCNLSMASLMYRRGLYEKSLCYLEAALKRSIDRNPNPYDTEVYYQMGVVLRQLGRSYDAVNCLKKAAWNYAWRSAGLQVAAELAAQKGDIETALNDSKESLKTNVRNQRATSLMIALYLRMKDFEAAEKLCHEALCYDKLDLQALFLLSYCYKLQGKDGQAGETLDMLKGIAGNKTTVFLNLAELHFRSGYYEAAWEALSASKLKTPMVAFYQAYCLHLSGKEADVQKYLSSAEEGMDEVFPNTDFDYIVLNYAATAYPEGAVAHYYLGCMDYERGNGERAICHWQQAVTRKPSYWEARRCLAQALFEILGDTAGAFREMTTAYEMNRCARIMFELYQLRRVTGTSLSDNFAFIKDNMEFVFSREDLCVQYIYLLCRSGEAEEAAKIMETRQFYTFEGGEGGVLRAHNYVYLCLGKKEISKKNYAAALKYFEKALEYPANYNEGPRHSANDALVFWHIAKAYELLGDCANRQKYLEKAAQSDESAELSEFYRAMAKRDLGDHLGAGQSYRRLISVGENFLKAESINFFGQFRITLPFEQSDIRALRDKGLSAIFYGQLGLGLIEEAEETRKLICKEGLDVIWTEFVTET